MCYFIHSTRHVYLLCFVDNDFPWPVPVPVHTNNTKESSSIVDAIQDSANRDDFNITISTTAIDENNDKNEHESLETFRNASKGTDL